MKIGKDGEKMFIFGLYTREKSLLGQQTKNSWKKMELR